MEWQFEFPAEIMAEREQVVAAILRLMAEDTQSAVQEACRMQLAWLERHPDDYGMLDLGESLWMLADAIAIMAEQGIEPLERVDVAKEMEHWEAEWEERQHAERVPDAGRVPAPAG